MSSEKVLKVHVSLKGRPVRAYRFAKDEITVGRNPECDIFLDNLGVSRAHLRFCRMPTGFYEVVDEGSANGTMVNEEQIQKVPVYQDDVVRVGKFTLWVGYDEDHRGQRAPGTSAKSAAAGEGTIVLSTTELDGMLARARMAEPSPETDSAARPFVVPLPAAQEPHRQSSPSRVRLLWSIAGALVLGVVAGAVALWLVLR